MTEDQMLYVKRNYRSIWAIHAVESVLKAAQLKDNPRAEYMLLLKVKNIIEMYIKHSHAYLSEVDPRKYGEEQKMDKDFIDIIYWLYRADHVNFEPPKEEHIKRALQAVERALKVREARNGEMANEQ